MSVSSFRPADRCFVARYQIGSSFGKIVMFRRLFHAHRKSTAGHGERPLSLSRSSASHAERLVEKISGVRKARRWLPAPAKSSPARRSASIASKTDVHSSRPDNGCVLFNTPHGALERVPARGWPTRTRPQLGIALRRGKRAYRLARGARVLSCLSWLTWPLFTPSSSTWRRAMSSSAFCE